MDIDNHHDRDDEGRMIITRDSSSPSLGLGVPPDPNSNEYADTVQFGEADVFPDQAGIASARGASSVGLEYLGAPPDPASEEYKRTVQFGEGDVFPDHPHLNKRGQGSNTKSSDHDDEAPSSTRTRKKTRPENSTVARRSGRILEPSTKGKQMLAEANRQGRGSDFSGAATSVNTFGETGEEEGEVEANTMATRRGITTSSTRKTAVASSSNDMPSRSIGPAKNVAWQSSEELKIALRMVYSKEYESQLNTPQRKADVWNEAVKDIETIKARNAFVPEQTMATQYSERNSSRKIPSVTHWKTVIEKMAPDDPKWVDMKQKFDAAIVELDRTNRWSTTILLP